MQVNEKRLIATLKDAFTNDYSVITEMAQNARRAGATRVTFNVKGLEKGEKDCGPVYSRGEKVLFHMEVIDDGAGISDMQNLISVASSGWDQETIDRESPFGMGFLIAVYSSSAITVKSQDKTFSATKEQLLGLEELEVKKCEMPVGTSITLEKIGFDRVTSLRDLKDLMSNLLSGFPIDVFLNVEDHGTIEMINSGYSITTLEKNSEYEEYSCEIGRIFMRKDFNLRTHYNYAYNMTGSPIHFFQGLPVGALNSRSVYGTSNDEKSSFVVHLNNSAGTIRLPDRDKFINQEQVKVIIDESIMALIKAFIISKKDDFSYLDEHYFRVKSLNLLELFNAHTTLPSSVLNKFADANIDNSDNHYDTDYVDWLYESIDIRHTKSTIAKRVVVTHSWDLPDDFGLDSTNDDYFGLAYALEKTVVPYVLICDTALHKDHWIYKDAIPITDVVKTLKVTAKGVRDPLLKHNNFYLQNHQIKMCQSFKISLTINGKKYSTGDQTKDFVMCEFNKQDIILYADECSSNYAVSYGHCFRDDSGFNETLQCEYEKAFDKWLKLERCEGDASKLIVRFLEEADLTGFEGKQFYIAIENGEITVKELTKGECIENSNHTKSSDRRLCS